jgi:hypothetical protein
MLDADTGELINSENLKVHPRMKELYKFFKYNGKVGDIKDCDPAILSIFSREVLDMISEGKRGWEKMLPEGVADLIKDYRMFGYTRKPIVLRKERLRKL